INENSYVDLKKETEKVNKDNMEINTSNIEFDEGKNIKKEDLYHIVKMDETLFSISRAYDISVDELRQWNFIEDLDKLAIGQRLLIKKTLETNDTLQNSNSATIFKTYKVKQDDTLYGIARKHNISIKELMELNNKNDFTIKEGESLKIKTQK
ncbi:MAG: LysM peptidoglycan-binding domain-containing protein, partial [Cyclobacteriaceae bacterium]|nr:LysM peptidoglycan-binding domain-containing protein [Cyclobacteriaceae bacterium]